MKCSIVIRSYNEEKHIGRLLDGIVQQNIQDPEIILVDSGSTDATTTIAASYPVTILHIQPNEFTFGRSLNSGIAQAKGEFVVIASAHVYPVYHDWLEKLLSPFNDPQVALTYGKQRGDTTTKFSENQIFTQWFPDQSHSHQTHPFCNNANAAIRRSLWELHAYDESLTGLEDLEWAQWAMGQDYAISYISEAEVIHVHNETPRDVYNRYRREAMGFKRIFPQERFNLTEFLRLVSTNIFNDIWHAVRKRVLRTNLSNILWFRWMQFWGTYQGYHHSGPITGKLRQTFYYPRELGTPPQSHPRDIAPIQYDNEPEG